MQSYSLQTVSGRGRRTVRGAAWRRAGRGARMADQYVHQAAGTHQTSERREAQVPVCRTGHPGRHLRGQDLPEDSGQRLHAVLTWNRWGPQGRSIYTICFNLPAGPLEPRAAIFVVRIRKYSHTPNVLHLIFYCNWEYCVLYRRHHFNGKITRRWQLKCFIKESGPKPYYSCLEIPLILNFLTRNRTYFRPRSISFHIINKHWRSF